MRLTISALLSLLALFSWSMRPDESAEKLLTKIREMKHPGVHWTGDLDKDLATNEQWQRDLRAFKNRLAAAIWTFYERYPQRPEVPDLLAKRWNALAGADISKIDEATANRGIEDAQLILRSRHGPELAKIADYWLASFRIARELRQHLGPSAIISEYRSYKTKYPEDPAAANLLYYAGFYWTEDYAAQREVYARLVADFPKHKSIERFRSVLRRSEAVGRPMDLSFTDAVNGKALSMADFKGKVVIVDCWAAWCGECLVQQRSLKSLYERYHGRGLEVVGVDFDANGGRKIAMLNAIKRNMLPAWPQCYLERGFLDSFALDWGLIDIPQTFLVDRSGHVTHIAVGGDLEPRVVRLLGN